MKTLKNSSFWQRGVEGVWYENASTVMTNQNDPISDLLKRLSCCVGGLI